MTKVVIVPPLPRRAPSREAIDAASAESGSTEMTALRQTTSIPPSTVDTIELHHGRSGWAALILVTGAALLVTPLVGSHRELDRSTSLGVARHAPNALAAPTRSAGAPVRPLPEVDTPIFEQFVQLDEVQITGTGDLRAERSPVFDGEQEAVRTALAPRTVSPEHSKGKYHVVTKHSDSSR